MTDFWRILSISDFRCKISDLKKSRINVTFLDYSLFFHNPSQNNFSNYDGFLTDSLILDHFHTILLFNKISHLWWIFDGFLYLALFFDNSSLQEIFPSVTNFWRILWFWIKIPSLRCGTSRFSGAPASQRKVTLLSHSVILAYFQTVHHSTKIFLFWWVFDGFPAKQ